MHKTRTKGKHRRFNNHRGRRIIIRDHVIERFIERVGVRDNETFNSIREKLVARFTKTSLKGIKKKGYEVWNEHPRIAIENQLTFVVNMKLDKVVVITTYLTGKKDDWWKNEGLNKNVKGITHDPEVIRKNGGR